MIAVLFGLTLLAAYLIGAIPFGYLVARWRGVDIFQQGSGNIGATNVGRVLGRRFGILVFVLDVAKGAVPVALAGWVGRQLDSELSATLSADAMPVGAGLAAFLGHLFSIYLRFRGGKGVATGAGVVAVLLPGPTLAGLLTWIAVVAASRYVSLASVAAAVALCLSRLCLLPEPFAPDHRLLTSFCLVAAGLVVLRHRANISRLLGGTENRLPETSTMLLLTKIVHVLSLGLWFGMGVFFTLIVGLSLFHTFETLGAKPAAQRPIWFPVAAEFDRDPQFLKDQGTRAAGAAISPLFDWFFLLQGVCGFLAVATALSWSWSQPHETVHKVRTILLVLALVTVVAGWPLERKVSQLRDVRHQTADAVLKSAAPVPEAVQEAANVARAEFGRWHGYSLLLTLCTVLLVTVAMALAASLPSANEKETSQAPAAKEATQPAESTPTS